MRQLLPAPRLAASRSAGWAGMAAAQEQQQRACGGAPGVPVSSAIEETGGAACQSTKPSQKTAFQANRSISRQSRRASLCGTEGGGVEGGHCLRAAERTRWQAGGMQDGAGMP